jgi:transcriptional regulatory protein RtcR
VEVLKICASTRSLSEAGRKLFSVSRGNRKVVTDADRLKKYLARWRQWWKFSNVEQIPILFHPAQAEP